ncbi:MAG: hypothetical protein GWM87_13315 [Xanthomonadales bacterium]|nr:hypothetical protein [Xanthomonadales bacterium]NIX13798.1 hypothetical protein [Xanthomonadales bacterium]
MSLFAELQRRNVFRVAIAYAVAAWVLLQIADLVLDNIEAPAWVMQAMMLVVALGFVASVIIAWAYELTPEGIKRESEVDPDASITAQTGRKLNQITIGLLLAVLAVVIADRLIPEGGTPAAPFPAVPEDAGPAAEAAVATPGQEAAAAPADAARDGRPSVAVLPFTAMSSGADDGYFADGLTEEILNALAGLPELLVTARTSSFHFKGRNLPVPEIAATLGVDHVVEGSVRRAGERVRITAQLIRAADGFHLWSDTYDHTLEDVFAVQEDIAFNIAETLNVVLDNDKRQRMRDAGIGDVEAFIAYQKGLEAFARAHEVIETASDNLQIAVRYFDQALAAAPDLVAARIMKADQRGHVIFELAAGLRTESYEGELDQALADLKEEYALAIEASPPGNQRHILELEAAIFSDDWSEMPLRIERALQPGDCPSMNWSMEFTINMGFADGVLDKIHELLRCDPFNFLGSYGLVGALFVNNEFEASIEASREALARGLDFNFIEEAGYLAYLAAGDLNAPEVTGPAPGRGFFQFDRQLTRQLLLGNTAAAMKIAEDFWAGPMANDWSSMIIAAMVGDRERANRHAARIDARPGSSIVLINGSYLCACGAPFDLGATPNLQARLAGSGLIWPRPAVIHYPAKDW